eukprot:symbB.v1.2.009902.t1/scaffold605.1/size182108/2
MDIGLLACQFLALAITRRSIFYASRNSSPGDDVSIGCRSGTGASTLSVQTHARGFAQTAKFPSHLLAGTGGLVSGPSSRLA